MATVTALRMVSHRRVSTVGTQSMKSPAPLAVADEWQQLRSRAAELKAGPQTEVKDSHVSRSELQNGEV